MTPLDPEKLSELSDQVFRALDAVADVDEPGVARLALATMTMLRYIESVVLEIANKELETVEEKRRVHKLELSAAEVAEEHVAKAVDCAMQGFALEVAKLALDLKETVHGMVEKLKAREAVGAEVDARVRFTRETMRARLQEQQDNADDGNE